RAVRVEHARAVGAAAERKDEAGDEKRESTAHGGRDYLAPPRGVDPPCRPELPARSSPPARGSRGRVRRTRASRPPPERGRGPAGEGCMATARSATASSREGETLLALLDRSVQGVAARSSCQRSIDEVYVASAPLAPAAPEMKIVETSPAARFERMLSLGGG